MLSEQGRKWCKRAAVWWGSRNLYMAKQLWFYFFNSEPVTIEALHRYFPVFKER